jgi:hypothetical protein
MSFENPLRAAPHIQALPPRLRQVLMTPGVRADRMTSDWSLLEDAGIISGMHSDREEDRHIVPLDGQHRLCVFRPRPVIEDTDVYSGPPIIRDRSLCTGFSDHTYGAGFPSCLDSCSEGCTEIFVLRPNAEKSIQ